jgi:hypothetical protein
MRIVIALIGLAVASIAHGAPIDFTTGISTSVVRSGRSGNMTDGAEVQFPIWDHVLNKAYTAQIVPTGSSVEESESYVQVDPTEKQYGFASAFANGEPVLEVGVQDYMFSQQINVALARYYTTIKNNTDEEIGFDFYFVIPAGNVEINGTRFADRYTARARVEATVDYLLRTPDGGTYVDTRAQPFKMYVETTNESRRGTIDHSSNITVGDLSDDRILYYKMAKYEGMVDLPIIPAYGELKIYYDMYAYYFQSGSENPGSAFLGDPAGLVREAGGRLVQDSASTVPEPSTLALASLALLCLGGLRNKQRPRA